jgi:hypothetical protein
MRILIARRIHVAKQYVRLQNQYDQQENSCHKIHMQHIESHVLEVNILYVLMFIHFYI